MDKHTHTPGPWCTSEPDGSFHDVIRIYSAEKKDDELPVAVCPQQHSVWARIFSGQGNSTSIAAANARLIAAAPGLLEALELICSNCAAKIDFTDQNAGETYYSIALAAIAKAKGESNA